MNEQVKINKLYYSNLQTPKEERSNINEEQNYENINKNKLLLDRIKKEKIKFDDMKELKKETIKTNKNKVNIKSEKYIIEFPKKKEINLEESQKESMKKEASKGRFEFNYLTQSDDKNAQTNLLYKEKEFKTEFKLFNREEIYNINNCNNKILYETSEEEQEEARNNNKKITIKDNENNNKKHNNYLKLQKEDKIGKNIKEKLKELESNDVKDNDINNFNVSNNVNNNKVYANNKKNNKNNLFLSNNCLPTKIKIFKCVIWKNNNPDLNEDILQTIFHYRNRSFGNNTFIMKLPEGTSTEENINPKGK